MKRTEPFARAHLLVRLLVCALCGALGRIVSWPFGVLLYFGLPVVAAVAVSRRGSETFLAEDTPAFQRVLGWILGFWAYLGLLTDHFPAGAADSPVRYEVRPSGHPTIASAALRVVTSIPAALILCIIGIASALLWLVSVVYVLVEARYPRWIFDFQCGVLRYQARLFSYHASLVDRYPPLTLELGATDPDEPAPTATASQT